LNFTAESISKFDQICFSPIWNHRKTVALYVVLPFLKGCAPKHQLGLWVRAWLSHALKTAAAGSAMRCRDTRNVAETIQGPPAVEKDVGWDGSWMLQVAWN
jgi:hypothetical protein